MALIYGHICCTSCIFFRFIPFSWIGFPSFLDLTVVIRGVRFVFKRDAFKKGELLDGVKRVFQPWSCRLRKFEVEQVVIVLYGEL